MKQQRTVIVLVVAIVTAAAAAYAVYRAIQNRPVMQVEDATVRVVAAARTIPVGTAVTKDDLKMISWPQANQVPGTYTDPDAVLGRSVVRTVGENEPLTSQNLASREAGSGLEPLIPPGMRAKAIRVNDVVGVAGYAIHGTRVDVIVAVDDDGDERNGRQPIAKTVVSNVLVLSARRRTDQDGGNGASQTTVVTLAVTPEDAERIALAEQRGQLSLTLRNPQDVQETTTQGVGMPGLMRGTEPPAPPQPVRSPAPRRVVTPPPAPEPPPPPPPPPPYEIETIRGGEKSTDTFETEETD